MKLIGHVFNTGRIDFTRVDNPWAFRRIDAGMKKSQADRIRMDPSQAPIELYSAPVNGDQVPDWLPQIQRFLKTADSVYLQYKSGVLRFRLASLDAGKNRTFITLGNQDEFASYAGLNWRNLRYMYAQRGGAATRFCFDVQTLITHRKGSEKLDQAVEVTARMVCDDGGGQPRLVINATGSDASVDVIEWRDTVKEGETGRYAIDGKRLEFSVRTVQRPFTLLHENRAEFNSDSYNFSSDKIDKLLNRVIDRRLKDLSDSVAVGSGDDDDLGLFED